MTKPKMVQLNFKVPEPLLARLKKEKERTGVPISEFIRRAILVKLKGKHA